MGALCSKSMPGEGRALGSSAPPTQRTQQPQPRAQPQVPAQSQSQPRRLGSTTSTQPQGTSPMSNPREAAAKAAEERVQAAKTRGVNAANPHAGSLSAKLDQQAKLAKQPERKEEERIIFD